MEIINLIKRDDVMGSKRAIVLYRFFEKLIDELRKRQIPQQVIVSINMEIQSINAYKGTAKSYLRHLEGVRSRLLPILDKRLKLVPRNYYRNFWMVMGISVFGLPIGLIFGNLIGNMGMLAIGLPIGMVLGIVVGDQLDKRAFKSGNQLDVEVDAKMF